jgi:hypothetical protein
LKDIDERLAIVNARGDYLSNGHITADLANFMKELKVYQGRRDVVLAREERDRDLLEYGLDWQLSRFVNAVRLSPFLSPSSPCLHFPYFIFFFLLVSSSKGVFQQITDSLKTTSKANFE